MDADLASVWFLFGCGTADLRWSDFEIAESGLRIRGDTSCGSAGVQYADSRGWYLRIGQVWTTVFAVVSPQAEPIYRHARSLVDAALLDTRVVVVLGARQVGKSTLAREVAMDRDGTSVLTFDDQQTREAAMQDPTGFIAGIAGPVVIDEIQRVPDVLLAIKQRVDRDLRPGQFLLTGSANILTAPNIADALAGRTEYIRLHPFSQGELAGRRETFLSSMFSGTPPLLYEQPVGRGPYAERIASGGYPEAIRRSGARRGRFFDAYLDSVMERDLRSIAGLADAANARRLLVGLASMSGSEVNSASLSRDLGLAEGTIRSYLDLLETLFLVRRLRPWSGNLFARAIKAPKVYVADAGLLMHLIGADARRVERDLQLGGSLFETFAALELIRQASWDDELLTLYHYRDREQREVDVIIERRDGSIIALEVKAAASVGRRDARGISYLRDKLGDRFVAGAVLYAGANTLPLGDRIWAVPLTGLWTAGVSTPQD